MDHTPGAGTGPHSRPSAGPGGRVPASLPVVATVSRYGTGPAWLARLPELIEEFRERWDLRLGEPFHGGSCSWVAPAWRRDGSGGPSVLKLTWPHPEARDEARAMRLWAGNGAALVYKDDAAHYALLLERCEPGTELAGAHGMPTDRRLAAGAEVVTELWHPPVPVSASTGDNPHREPGGPADAGFQRLADLTGEGASLLEQRAARHWPEEIDTGLFEVAARLLRELPRTASREVVLHGDFNPGNVLAAGRRPWLAIDAKPMTGDPAYELWPLIEQIDDPFALPDPHAALTHRTALLAGLTGEDAARIRAWAVARQVQYALWSASLGAAPATTVKEMRRARLLADVAGL